LQYSLTYKLQRQRGDMDSSEWAVGRPSPTTISTKNLAILYLFVARIFAGSNGHCFHTILVSSAHANDTSSVRTEVASIYHYSWARHNGHESAIRIFLQFLCFYRAEKTQKALFMLPFRVSCSLRQAQRMECSLTLERQLERGKKKNRGKNKCG
jgi:hypothetical protein